MGTYLEQPPKIAASFNTCAKSLSRVRLFETP